ncbi:hypothetical protein PC118_g20298 [Phytophthora cactorum]|uniref:Secreted protein n=1 Tax=Phytophthora cactorum TaxID=29920 RepID=A0A8T0YM94_9STRA|nr:hypothetical protein PC113_g17338 [Phytophthora cactorum]KAG2879332.1 hypothetical protein PC114_g22621 [Phytophthora cactorum]KAG2888159.1 hypothetical protein PC115_g20140 [Phytophthora cactorum]KAG2964478.1 hypothetical protein PC118_g20298 [Phytophthora cactorum]KAG2994600.1 hypothetical protein PC120_g21954 [Phytophthora cactorum]
MNTQGAPMGLLLLVPAIIRAGAGFSPSVPVDAPSLVPNPSPVVPRRDTRGPSSVVLPVLCECLITSARYVAVHQCRDLLRQHDPL